VVAADGVVVFVGVDRMRSGDDADDFIVYIFSADVILVAVVVAMVDVMVLEDSGGCITIVVVVGVE
jgi:hypothetical protein